VIKQ
jgi:hypothetical protein